MNTAALHPTSSPDILATALEAHAAGIRVLPVAENGSKALAVDPATRPGRSDLERWFGAEGRTGIAVVCGRASDGLELLETEVPGAFAALGALCKLVGLGDLWRRLVLGWLDRSPRGGFHFYYRVRPAPTLPGKLVPAWGVRDAAKWADPLIETRGERGYAVAAPSHGGIHPTGRPYRRLSGGPATLPTISPQERAELLRVCIVINATWAPPPHDLDGPTVVARPAHAGDPAEIDANAFWDAAEQATRRARRIARDSGRRSDPDHYAAVDDFNAATAALALLEPRGWRVQVRYGDSPVLAAPGQARGVAALVDPSGVLRVLANADGLKAGGSYTAFGAMAALEHGGNRRAALEAIRRVSKTGK